MNIATVLRSWRLHEELTLSEASKRIGIPLPTYHRIENGEAMDGKNMAALLRWLLEKEPSSRAA